MSVVEQLAALSEMRKIVAKHFPKIDFYYIEHEARQYIEIEITAQQYIVFDEEKQVYHLEVPPCCKVCETTMIQLIEIPTMSGKVYLCEVCRDEIASARLLAQ